MSGMFASISAGGKIAEFFNNVFNFFKREKQKKEIKEAVKNEDQRQRDYREADKKAQSGDTCELEAQFDRSKSCPPKQ